MIRAQTRVTGIDIEKPYWFDPSLPGIMYFQLDYDDPFYEMYYFRIRDMGTSYYNVTQDALDKHYHTEERINYLTGQTVKYHIFDDDLEADYEEDYEYMQPEPTLRSVLRAMCNLRHRSEPWRLTKIIVKKNINDLMGDTAAFRRDLWFKSDNDYHIAIETWFPTSTYALLHLCDWAMHLQDTNFLRAMKTHFINDRVIADRVSIYV